MARRLLDRKQRVFHAIYGVFNAQADWTLTHTSHKGTEQSTIGASIAFDSATMTHCSGDHRMNGLQFADEMFWTSNKPAK
jgi:hypothetical protein